jgi:hypothetical protein
MSHCCLSFHLRFLIIPLVSSGHCVVCLLYYYSSKKKKARENDITSSYDVTSVYDVTSGHVIDVTSGHVTNVTSGHLTGVTSGHVISVHVTSGDVLSCDVSSGSTPFPNYDGLQILKTVEVLIKPLTYGCHHIHRVMMKNPIIF